MDVWQRLCLTRTTTWSGYFWTFTAYFSEVRCTFHFHFDELEIPQAPLIYHRRMIESTSEHTTTA
jgi:hypothetical protein